MNYDKEGMYINKINHKIIDGVKKSQGNWRVKKISCQKRI